MGTGDLFVPMGQGREASDARRCTVYPRMVPLEQLGLPTRSPLVALPARTPLFGLDRVADHNPSGDMLMAALGPGFTVSMLPIQFQ